ncbi:LysR family transcriptional regulator [Celeribacter indicus]|uniref:LysR family transcriptional regulator n=1 Tax=Celeribacter indicus TaxID=1208324 RepID=A0A0B5E6U7_9RHOB|nr:LysR family transcriptional regulator [Celeribacter indicus]AJE48726.1 LysR family transcriptional regulator [Celeribacter indicus]SDX12012.1 transcriptional regulator, LysR family [Celeribacter indicus]
MKNLELFRAFAVLGELGNFNAAAAQLGIAQPTLTKQIARLEDMLGTQLFLRSRQGTELTDFGRQYLAEVNPLVCEAERIWDLGQRMARGETGRLAIGFTFSALEVVTRALIAYREAYPEVELTFDDISSQAQIPMVRDRRLDVAFARWPGAPDLASRQVARDRLAFVFPVRLSDRITSIDSPAVRDLPFIRLKTSVAPGFEGAVERLFAWKEINPAVIHWVNESLVQLRMVSAGFGVAVMHESALAGVIDSHEIIAQGIEGPALSWQVGVFWRKDEKSPAVWNFLRIAQALDERAPQE